MEPFVDYMNSFAVRVGNIYGYDSNALELAKAVLKKHINWCRPIVITLGLDQTVRFQFPLFRIPVSLLAAI